jgi:hypothetical protein
LSWSGLNQSLPNLPAGRLLSVPNGARGVRMAIAGVAEMDWSESEKTACKLVDQSTLQRENAMTGAPMRSDPKLGNACA